MTVLAFECYADQDVYLFLRDHLKLPLRKLHSYSQGEVINDLLEKERANVGLVDEDPGASHHRARDAMSVVSETQDVEVRRQKDRILLILKPALEQCFFTGLKRVGLSSEIAATASDLERKLTHPDPRHSIHKAFRVELERLHGESRTTKTATFLTDLQDALELLV